VAVGKPAGEEEEGKKNSSGGRTVDSGFFWPRGCEWLLGEGEMADCQEGDEDDGDGTAGGNVGDLISRGGSLALRFWESKSQGPRGRGWSSFFSNGGACLEKMS